jgi:DNA-binding transcriptional LysR family regulator
VNVELRHLRSFVVLAEELSFTRAAARLHLAQQALSAQMKQLEQRLGAQLFARTTRSVELTPAGRALMERVPALLAGLDDALESARAAARGETGHLTVGLLAAAPLDLTPRVLREFSRRRPAASVAVRNVPFTDPSGGVRTGEADVAIVWLPFATDDLDVEVLLEDERAAVLPADHPLAAQTEVRAADLAAEPFGWIDDLDPVARDFWTLAAHRDGHPARIGARITGFDDYFAAVRSGQAVAATPASIARMLSWPDIAVRPLPDAEPARLAVCRRAHDPNPLATIFGNAARELAGTA